MRNAVVVSCLVMLGCGGDPAGRETTVVDSAGVAIVTSHVPASGAGQWRVDAEPEWSVGVVDGAPEYMFSGIVGVATLPGGVVAVADVGSSQIRLYDSTGTFLNAFGRAGEGPGEFRQISALFRIGDDLLAVHDALTWLHLYRSDGTFVGSHRIGSLPLRMDPVTLHLTPPMAPVLVGWLNERTYVAIESTPVTLSGGRGFTEPQRVDILVRRGQLGDTAALVRRLEGPVHHPHPMNLIMPAVFGPSVHVAAGAGGIVVASNVHNEVRWLDAEGRLERIARLPWPPVPVTPAMIEEYVQRSVPPLNERIARGRSFAEVLPAFSDVKVDAAGQVWVRRYDPVHATTLAQYIPTYDRASTWAVLDGEGRWLGEVELPARFAPLEIGGGYVIGLYRDADDVEYVRRYRVLGAEG